MINYLSKTDDFKKIINSLSKTDGFIKNDNSLTKTDDFIKKLNLLSETHVFFWSSFRSCWSYFYVLGWKNNVFLTPRRKTMQNHYEIASKSQFMDPKRAKLNRKSDFGHVWTYC